MAGYFSGIRRRQRSSYPAPVFATTLYWLGDTDFIAPITTARHENVPRRLLPDATRLII
jgi:hypothetical protein